MNNNLMTYIGIDDCINLDEFDYVKDFKINGSIDVDNEVNDLLSFSISKECIGYKYISTFCEMNYEKLNIDGNLIIINNKLDLNFEYSVKNSSRINLLSASLFKTTYLSIEDYLNENLEIQLIVLDLYSNMLDNKQIYYAINMMICINCR